MPTRFVCLANSYKEHGRCVAGICLDKKNRPIVETGRPKWIRPVSSEGHGEIPTDAVSHIELLTIVEIDVINFMGEGHQSENALFDEDAIREVGTFPISGLAELCENTRPNIFRNRGKAVSEEDIDNLNHSLVLVRIDDFKILEKPKEYKPGVTQLRLSFNYKNIPYEFTITDPVFIEKYRNDAQFVDNVEEIFLTLSLAGKWQGWYHKLVAGVILH
jgi:hypothetical protein